MPTYNFLLLELSYEYQNRKIIVGIYSEVIISLMIEENMEQVDSRENGFALEVKNFLIGRVYLNISRCKK